MHKMRELGKAEFGATTFCASHHPTDKCGANGLPLTPSSIKILGYFPALKALDHPRLCKYLDLVRCAHERVIVVAEHYKDNAEKLITNGSSIRSEVILRLGFQVLEGLAYLNQNGIIHRNLHPASILLTEQKDVRLAKWGMYKMTDYGADVCFPIGHPKYLAPEVLAIGPVKLLEITVGEECELHPMQPPSGFKCDVWSLGICLVEILLGIHLWSTLTQQQILHKILGFLKTDIPPLEIITRDHHLEDKIKALPAGVQLLLTNCLTVNVKNRPSPVELLQFAVFKEQNLKQVTHKNGFSMFATYARCLELDLPSYDDEDRDRGSDDLLSERSLEEVYYLWKLAGGDLEAVLKKAGLIRTRPPVVKVGSLVTEGDMVGEKRDHSTLLDETVIILTQDQLRQRLENVDPAAYFPLLEDSEENNTQKSGPLPKSQSSASVDFVDTTKLPLVIREKDVEYQFHRIILYERLLKAYPYKRADIWKEARIDIPPLVRGDVWAALLDVEGDVQGR